MKKLLTFLLLPTQFFANEAAEASQSLFLANQFTRSNDNWVQLSPFGDFGNVDKHKARVIQRFQKADAEAICNEFNGLGRKVVQPLGMPFYVGHPDHPRFKGQPGHTDTGAKGRGKEMAVRHDAACTKCADFANSGVPCGDHGLFVKMTWNPEGEDLIANEAFHGHSVNWGAVPAGKENGVAIFRPIRVKSAGFTNEPQIPVVPASLANEAENEELGNEGMIIPPKLKVLAGFAADANCSLEEILAALEKAQNVANEAALEKLRTESETLLANEKTARETAETNFANERKARATQFVIGLVKAGKVKLVDQAAKVEELVNAGESYAAKETELANGAVIVKVTARSTDLAGKHAVLSTDARKRTEQFEALMAKRAQELPNESYEARFNAVADSSEGQQLFAQMQRAGADD